MASKMKHTPGRKTHEGSVLNIGERRCCVQMKTSSTTYRQTGLVGMELSGRDLQLMTMQILDRCPHQQSIPHRSQSRYVLIRRGINRMAGLCMKLRPIPSQIWVFAVPWAYEGVSGRCAKPRPVDEDEDEARGNLASTRNRRLFALPLHSGINMCKRHVHVVSSLLPQNTWSKNQCPKRTPKSTIKTHHLYVHRRNSRRHSYRRWPLPGERLSPVKVPNDTCLSLSMSQTLILFGSATRTNHTPD